MLNRITNEREITANTTEIPTIIILYNYIYIIYNITYSNKLDNPEEMGNFLETYKLSKLKQKEIENLNRPITSKEIESVIKKLPTNESPGPDGFTGQTFQEELIPTLLKLFQKKHRKGRKTSKFIL